MGAAQIRRTDDILDFWFSPWFHGELLDPTIHIPVLLQESLDSLHISEGMTIVDGTFGGGGHSRKIAERVGASGQVISIDQDPSAFDRAEDWLEDFPIQPVVGNFRHLPKILDAFGLKSIDGVLLDIGLSSDQLADDERGFSFHAQGDLDLRFDSTRGEPAWKLLNRLSAKHIADLIYYNSDERYSRRIARKIVESRRDRPIRKTQDFVELVRSVVPKSKSHSIDPATRTMQALRIAVNDELAALDEALKVIPDLLAPSARFLVISFHSLEDRRVKNAFREDERLEIVTRNPICPSEEELLVNSRAKSAKLRVAKRLSGKKHP